MPIHHFKLRLVSPTFIAGIDKNRPEMRAASIRGQLRYWLRAMIGAYTTNLKKIWAEESQIFGSTDIGSSLSVRVYPTAPVKSNDYAMLPHRSNEGRRGLSIQKALDAGQIFDLQLVTRPGVPLSAEALDALKLWSLLGGVGRRSRRMFGAVHITKGDENELDWYAPPQTPDELAGLIQAVLGQTVSASPYGGIPNFPTLNLEHSWVIVGQMPYATQEDAVIDLFRNLLRIPVFMAKQDTFGQAMGGRRASPLIAQVRRIRSEGVDQYYPVLTALRSKPDQRIDWAHLKQFMLAAESYFGAVRVWGGW